MTRLLLACLLLWSQLAFSIHELDASNYGHLHAADCSICIFGHAAGTGLVSAELSIEPVAVAESPVFFTPAAPAVRFYSSPSIRAPPRT